MKIEMSIKRKMIFDTILKCTKDGEFGESLTIHQKMLEKPNSWSKFQNDPKNQLIESIKWPQMLPISTGVKNW